MIKGRLYISILMLFNFSFFINAQDLYITGTVENSEREPLAGVVIATDDGSNKVISDIDGHFSLANIKREGNLIFSLLGYKTLKEKIKDNITVIMNNDIHFMDSKIELGYTSILKNDFSGSASTVYSNQLGKAPVSVLMQTFAGNLSGLIARESYSESGREDYDLHVRGLSNVHNNQPLVIIDGVICYPGTSSSCMSYITPAEIESVTILKDAASQAIYGTEGADGVIVITTKRGVAGKMKIDCSVDASLQEVTTKPTSINSAEYAILRNEAAYNDGMGKNYYYSDSDIEQYRSGKNKYLYPNTNWQSMLLKKYIPMERIGVNISGGSDLVNYFSNFNIMHDEGPYKTEQGNGSINSNYNRNNNYFVVNFRSNIDVKVGKYLGAYMNLACNLRKEHTPGAGYFNNIYPHLFTMPPTVYGPVTPDIDIAGYPTNEVVVTEKENSSPFGMINRTGYINNTITNVYADFGLRMNLESLLRGLTLIGDVAYTSYTLNSLSTTKDYMRYERDTSYADDLYYKRKGTSDNSSLSYGKSSSVFYDLYYRGRLSYKLDLQEHHIDAMAYSFYQHYESKSTSAPALLPYDHIISGMDLAYNYAHRYALRLNLGYSGSEAFIRSKRWTATPAASAAWIISNESFVKTISAISLAKIRVAYGVTANDQAGLSRYYYEDNVKMGTGGAISGLQFNISENSIGNPNIKAETMKKFNFGFDLGLFNTINLSVDLFKENMGNMICSSTALVPTYQGVSLDIYPETNSGHYENKGYEVELSIGKSYKNFRFNIGGFLAYNKNKIKDIGEISLGNDYAYPYRSEGYSYGQTFGYKVDYSNGNGFYNFQKEIDNGPKYSFGTPRVGDLKYQDLNHDGVINEKDKAPITYGVIPNYTFGINTYFKYKGFDLSLLFQGVQRWKSFYSGMGIWETSYDGVYGALHENAWTLDRWNNDKKITSPALSTTTSVNQQTNDYYVYDCSYVRLKNVEVGYIVPARLTKRIGIQMLRLVLSGQNLITWDHMKSSDFGPEASTYTSIPVYKVYNIGFRATF